MAEEEKSESWWLLVLQGIGALIFTGFIYWALTRLEESGEAANAPWWFVLLYNWGGKWLVVGILGLGSVLLLYSGIEKLIVGEAKPGSPTAG
jgi:hypothetical protein